MHLMDAPMSPEMKHQRTAIMCKPRSACIATSGRALPTMHTSFATNVGNMCVRRRKAMTLRSSALPCS